jgi:hypothetical protein
LALAFSTLVFICTALMTGGCADLAVPAAIAGAARTETASSAAAIVFSMVVSLLKGIKKLAGRLAGLVDHAVTLGAAG